MSEQNPEKLVNSLRNSLLDLQHSANHNKGDEIVKATYEEAPQIASEKLKSIAEILYSSGDKHRSQSLQLEINKSDVLLQIVYTLAFLTSQDLIKVKRIFLILLRSRNTVDHLLGRPEVSAALLKGYEDRNIATECGKLLREFIRDESLCSMVLHSEEFYNLFRIIETSNAEISADAFLTLESLLKTHKVLSARFIENNYDGIFERYNLLLRSEDYVVRQRSIRILADLLQDDTYTGLRRQYLDNHSNLKFVMITMRNSTEDIQFEMFHIFKVFVADPNKTSSVEHSLARNKEKIIRFMGNFLQDRESRSHIFKQEKDKVVQQVSEIISTSDDWDDWSMYSATL